MSEENLDSVATVSGDVYDYLDEKPEIQAPKTDKVEGKVEDETKTEDAPEGEETGEETEEHKPWKSKNKAETPAWAQKRFKEYSSTVRELKDQNTQLMDTVKQFLNQNKPNKAELTRADFPDDESYFDYKAEQKVQAKLSEYETRVQEQAKQEAELQRVRTADAQNVQNAKVDLPDYDEVIQNGDPDVRLPRNVIDHLAISPAGAYVKYRIAQDESITQQLKQATPQEKVQIVSELHDSILDYLIKRNAQPATATQETSVQTKANPVAPVKKAPPKPPTKVKSGTQRDIMSLSGDAYARARNEQLNKR